MLQVPAMRIFFFLLLTISLTEAAAKPSALTVHFDDAEHYTDVSLSGASTDNIRQSVLDGLQDYLVTLADDKLPKQQTLSIDILDIDMAGAFEPWRTPQLTNTRIIRDIYPPRIKLHYVWRNSQGMRLAEADETLSDLNYLQFADPGYIRNDPLRYEKTLLRRWFETRFATPPR